MGRRMPRADRFYKWPLGDHLEAAAERARRRAADLTPQGPRPQAERWHDTPAANRVPEEDNVTGPGRQGRSARQPRANRARNGAQHPQADRQRGPAWSCPLGDIALVPCPDDAHNRPDHRRPHQQPRVGRVEPPPQPHSRRRQQREQQDQPPPPPRPTPRCRRGPQRHRIRVGLACTLSHSTLFVWLVTPPYPGCSAPPTTPRPPQHQAAARKARSGRTTSHSRTWTRARRCDLFGTICLLHLTQPHKHARHCLHWTEDLVGRVMGEHRNPNWTGRGRLVRVALAAGLTFELAWVEYPATRSRERRIKNQGSAYRRCPLCRGIGGPLDPVAVMAAAGAAQTGRAEVR